MSSMIPDPMQDSTWLITAVADPEFGEVRGPTVLANVHSAKVCSGHHCSVHNPSDHHMRGWAMLWRDDRKILERICAHGIGHPDPDDMAHRLRVNSDADGVHGCDGCCQP